MKKILLFLIISSTLFCAEAAGADAVNEIMLSMPETDVSDKSLQEQARRSLLAENLDESIRFYAAAVARQQEVRSQGRQVSPELLGEYAYALALAQAQSQALKTIDIALSLSSLRDVPQFYIFAVLFVTGFPDEADILAGCNAEVWCKKAPKWLNGQGFRINARYAAPSAIQIGSISSGVKDLRSLVSNKRKIEAVAYSSAFMTQFPESQLAYLLASSAWENLKCYKQAFQTFEKGFILADKEGASLTRQAMLAQYDYLQKQSRKKGDRMAFSPPVMTYIYGGVGYGNQNFTLQARYGMTQGPLSVSFDASISIPDGGKVYQSYGVTGYYRWKKLVAGLGMAYYDKSFAFTPTIGLSFFNSSRTSSLDLMLTSYLPIGGNASCGFTLSIGKTFYFKL